MKELTEFYWIVNLLSDNELADTFLFKNGGSIKEFEKKAKASINNSEFRKWFHQMISSDIIVSMGHEENTHGIDTKIYTIKKILMINHLNELDIYKKVHPIAIHDEFAIKRN